MREQKYRTLRGLKKSLRKNEENENSHRSSCFRAKVNIVLRLQDVPFVIHNNAPQTEVKYNLMNF
jgi:hypothetical protein